MVDFGVKVSATIITLNEEKHITRCIDSLQGIADEIIVVDSFSTDRTAELCRAYSNVSFMQHPFAGHIEQKNYAIDQAQHDIILALDADEVLSEELRANILQVKQNWQADGYYFNRLTHYAGHWVRYCGWYPDRKLRLFNKHKARWGGDNPHDIIIMQSGASQMYLNGDILHYSYDSISDHINQTNKFTTISAQSAYTKGVRSNLLKIVTRPWLKFIRDYFFKRGILDGRHGFYICYINALSAFLKYAKLYELQKGKKR